MIELNNLSYTCGDFPVLKQISLKMGNGKCYGIYGAESAGKSLLFSLMAGGLPPQSGSVRINGFDTRRDPVSARRCVGYMPQTIGFYREMTVYECLDFVAEARNVRADRRFQHVHNTLEITGLGDWRNRLIATLNAEQLRRLAFVQTLIGNPEILILDEPAQGLNAAARTALYDLIAAVVAEHKKTLFLASSSATVAELCGELFVLHDGILDPDLTGAAGDELRRYAAVRNSAAEGEET